MLIVKPAPFPIIQQPLSIAQHEQDESRLCDEEEFYVHNRIHRGLQLSYNLVQHLIRLCFQHVLLREQECAMEIEDRFLDTN